MVVVTVAVLLTHCIHVQHTTQDAIGERDLLSLLDGITTSSPVDTPGKQRSESSPEFPTSSSPGATTYQRSMRESAPGPETVPEEDEDQEEEEEEDEEPEPEPEPSLQDFTVECGLGTGGFAAVVLVEHNKTGKVKH